MMSTDKVILHCDANNFFASVACCINPTLKGKCIAVCGDPEKRHGIVLAKSQEAKIFGVSTGDTIWQAKLKCPDLVVVQPAFDAIINYSNALFNLYTQYTDRVEAFGMDECWLDVTHSKIFGSGEKIANELRERVKKELNLTISVGVSFNKIFAKLGSDMKKPDGTTVISKENYRSLIYSKDASDLLMVGRKTIKALHKMNIKTIMDLANADRTLLVANLGTNGAVLHNWANGIDDTPVNLYYEHVAPKQISNSITTYIDLKTDIQKFSVLRALCELISTRLVRENFVTTGIHLGLKFNDFTFYGRQMQIFATNSAISIFESAKTILKQCENKAPVRAISVAAIKLSSFDNIQLDIFNMDFDKKNHLTNSLEKIKQKYGYKTIIPASTLINKSLCEHIEVSDFKPFKH